MPQLDLTLFFMESVSLIISFFSLVFYNQYIFYPKLVKNIFVRRILLLNYKSTVKLLNKNYFYNYKKFEIIDFYFCKTKIKNLTKILFNKTLKIYYKINFILFIKLKNIKNTLNLLINKLICIFNIFNKLNFNNFKTKRKI